MLISPRASTDVRIGPGQVGGTVTDAAGAVISGVHVTVTHQNGQQYDAISNADGRWAVPRMLPGKVTVRAEAAGFARLARTLDLGPGPLSVALTLQVGSVSETIGVTSGAPVLQTQQSERALRQNAAPPSANVSSLQQRLTGVLPIAVTVPRAGTAYRFIRPLVVDEETKLAFQYRTGK
ncbi:MAG: carboxypeptidase-like regulatory domain-containing protein [Bryobacteraceae bacterium]